MAQENILFLGPENLSLESWLREQGEQITRKQDKLSMQFITEHAFTFLVSYGYKHILPQDILDVFPDRAINLHISYLPYNRGYYPNLWSFIEDTPKGVTIHYLDESIDTGDIIVQKELQFDESRETLATSYIKLQLAIQDLFKQSWNDIKNENCQRQKQTGKGSMHRCRDKEAIDHLLTNGWDTPVSLLKKSKMTSK